MGKEFSMFDYSCNDIHVHIFQRCVVIVCSYVLMEGPIGLWRLA